MDKVPENISLTWGISTSPACWPLLWPAQGFHSTFLLFPILSFFSRGFRCDASTMSLQATGRGQKTKNFEAALLCSASCQADHFRAYTANKTGIHFRSWGIREGSEEKKGQHMGHLAGTSSSHTPY